MAISAKSKRKFEVLVEVYGNIGHEFKEINDTQLISIADSWKKSIEKINSISQTSQPDVRFSAIITGLEQGLREIPFILRNTPQHIQKIALKKFYYAIESKIPTFFEKERKIYNEIVERGLIKTEYEFYLVSNYADEIENDLQKTDVLIYLRNLLSEYEKQPHNTSINRDG